MFALFLDLEHKLYVWRLYVTFEPSSPMSWGSWILLLVYPVLGAQVVARPAGPGGGLLPRPGPRLRAPGRLAARHLGAGLAERRLGVALGIYTGILLGSLGARPLWNSALLGPLFLVSGLSAGAAFGHLVASDPEERVTLARIDIAALVVEVGLVGLMLLALLGGATAHREAAGLLLGGPYTAVFWVLARGPGHAAAARRPGPRGDPPHRAHAGGSAARAGGRPGAALRDRLRRPGQPLGAGLIWR